MSAGWAMVFIANGLTKEHGVRLPDVLLAGAPFIAGLLLAKIGRYVVYGTRQ